MKPSIKLIRKSDLKRIFTSNDFLKRLEKAAVITWNTDHEAGFGLAVAEAMAAGLPVVGWDIGILGYVYKSGYIKVPLNNYNQFARSILKLLHDDALPVI